MQLPNLIKTPPFLQKLHWVSNPIGYMENAAQQYPDIFTARIIGFGNTVVFVNHPQAIQEILTNDRKKFAAIGELNRIVEPLLGKYSILFLDGDRHKHQRKLVVPSFHRERMQAYGQLICNISKKIFSQPSLNKPFLARNLTQEISMHIILQAVFGLYEGEKIQKLKQLLPLLLELFNSPLTSSLFFFPFLQQDLGAWSPWGKFLRDRQEIERFLDAEIAECQQRPDPQRIDILSLLVSSRDEAGQPMTHQELRDQLITLILAGYETTASAMAWGLYWVYQKPQIREKLLQELSTLGDSPDPMSISRLPYLTAVCNETLRIYPITMFCFPRVVQEAVELLGHAIDPGTILIPSIYLTHHRQDLYPESKKFRPERFTERQFSPYEFMPFGGGVRRCIGEALAIFQLKLVLATILSHYDLALVDRRPEQPRRRGFNITPGSGVKMVVTGRRMPQESLPKITTTSVS